MKTAFISNATREKIPEKKSNQVRNLKIVFIYLIETTKHLIAILSTKISCCSSQTNFAGSTFVIKKQNFVQKQTFLLTGKYNKVRTTKCLCVLIKEFSKPNYGCFNKNFIATINYLLKQPKFGWGSTNLLF